MWKISSVTDELTAAQSTGTDLTASRVLRRIKGVGPLLLIWWCFALATLCSSVVRHSESDSGFTYSALVIVGSGACGWFWFLSRALFRDKRHLGPAVFALVPVIVTVEAAATLMPAAGTPGMATEVGRMINNAASLVCIAAIAFVWREALHDYLVLSSPAERRFRQIYVGSFSLLVAITLLWVSGARPGSLAADWQAMLLTSSAVLTLAGGLVAVQYRLRHPLSVSGGLERSRAVPSDDEQSDVLAQRILRAIEDENLLTTSNLKVAEFAARVGELEYKVTRCITNRLRYRNFNHLLNSYRVERAKRLFDDADCQHLNIASIAYDCGFNSLGPFNRAFRQHTGITPREYRRNSD
jgi:AraC-like DNA-binding protein